MMRHLPCVCLMSLCLAACATKREVVDTAPVADAAAEADQAIANLGNPLLANKGDINSVNYSVSSTEDLEKIDNGSEEDLIWTNPDDPDAEIPGLVEAFENKRSGNGWLVDFGRAVQLARREERPLIVWFHDSLVSPKSNILGREYLDTKEFHDWCKNRVVRVRLDSGASLNEATEDRARYSHTAINALQKRYGLKKKPAFAVIAPSGKIVARIDGFDGFLSGFALDLKDGVAKAESEYKAYKERMRERGYRTWHSRTSDTTVFAKLMRYDEASRTVYLKESGGRVSRTKLDAFSQEDVDYLLSEHSKKKSRAKTHEPI